MSDDLRAAAQRLRDYAASPDSEIYGSDVPVLIDVVTQGLLSLLPPADDGEPVTNAWLRSVGFQETGKGVGVLAVLTVDDSPVRLHRWLENWIGGSERLWVYACIGQAADRVSVPSPQTRGDVRRLAAVLGITLKETT